MKTVESPSSERISTWDELLWKKCVRALQTWQICCKQTEEGLISKREKKEAKKVGRRAVKVEMGVLLL